MVYQVSANQPQGSRPTGRPRSRWWDCVYGDIRKCKIRNWEPRAKNREDWMRSGGEVPHRAVQLTVPFSFSNSLAVIIFSTKVKRLNKFIFLDLSQLTLRSCAVPL
jgi:hypothetical protein